MSSTLGLATLDTNVAIYAVTTSAKRMQANQVIANCDFLSVQLLNEFANVSFRKRRRTWSDISEDLEAIRRAVPIIRPIEDGDHIAALRLASRYQLSFYDALMLAVALSGGATVFYSEDMQHDLFVDDQLRIVNPFRESPA